MRTYRIKRSVTVLLPLALASAIALAGCQSSPQQTSEKAQQDTTNATTTSEQQAPSEEPDLAGVSMAGALTLNSDDRENLGWTGAMDVQVKSATIYRDFDAAERQIERPIFAGKDAVKDAPILMCEVYLDNQNAKSTAEDDLFKTDFMFLGPDRIPVSFYVPAEQHSDSDGSTMAFSLPQKESTVITVGFTAPQTWFDGNADLANRDYLAFGGTKEQYHRVGEGLVPDNDFIWLSTTVSDGE